MNKTEALAYLDSVEGELWRIRIDMEKADSGNRDAGQRLRAACQDGVRKLKEVRAWCLRSDRLSTNRPRVIAPEVRTMNSKAVLELIGAVSITVTQIGALTTNGANRKASKLCMHAAFGLRQVRRYSLLHHKVYR